MGIFCSGSEIDYDARWAELDGASLVLGLMPFNEAFERAFVYGVLCCILFTRISGTLSWS